MKEGPAVALARYPTDKSWVDAYFQDPSGGFVTRRR